MKSLQVLLISLSLIILVPLLIVESSSSNDSAVSNIGSSVTTPLKDMSVSSITGDPPASAPSNDRGSSVPVPSNGPSVSTPSDDTSAANRITRGSSISGFLNDTGEFWVSPSGNAMFGFYKVICSWYALAYPFCAKHHGVGILFVKPSTLIWTTDRDDYKLPSSILLNNEGKLVWTLEDNTEQQPLIPYIQEPASYAMMHDSGNFVLYGSESQIVWQTFDHPAASDPSVLQICLLIVKVFVCSAAVFFVLVIFFAIVRAAWNCVRSQQHHMELCAFLS